MEDLKKKWGKITEGVSGWVLYGLIGIILAVGVHSALGVILSTQYPVVTVKSESMVPTLKVGDMVFVRGSENYSPGDIVVFSGWKKTPIIHRIVMKGDEDGEGIKIGRWKNFSQFSEKELKRKINTSSYDTLYITKGDHNSKCDQCYPNGFTGSYNFLKPEDIHGKSMFKIPYLGLLKLEFVRLSTLLLK